MSEEDGLLNAFVLDGRGGARALGWDEIPAWKPEDGVLWVHLSRSVERAKSWVREEAGLLELVQEALLADDTRPRLTTMDGGMMINLRGVNLNPGQDPEDMVALRMWLEPNRVVTSRSRRLMAVADIRHEIERGTGPTGPSELLLEIAERLVDRMGPVISEIDEEVGALEDRIVEAQSGELRSALGHVRRTAIALRRYLSPQRDVMARLQTERATQFTEQQRYRAREIADRVTRYVEDLDAARERAAVIQEELQNRMSDALNQRMYVLSIVTSVFLPLGFITGLFGINVGGMPGVDSDVAFTIVTVGLVIMAALQFLYFYRRRLL